MKKLLIGLFLLFVSTGYSQSYKFGAIGTTSFASKILGNITINDEKVIIDSQYDGKETLSEYQLVKKTNGLVYFTDGVMTHYFSFVKQKGSKKGFDYDTWVIFNFDKSQSTEQIIYYSKLQE